MTTAAVPRGSKTALITGATGGIGLDLATIFARDGYRLVLVARRATELASIAARLTQTYGVPIETIAADLSDADAADRLAAMLREREIGVDLLVNNAGYAQFGAFVEADEDAQQRMIQLNMVTLTRLTRLLLPAMIARGWGRVLNVASTAAFMPGPLMAVYYASKAYVLSLSEALNDELRGTGVSVTALCPGPTRTGFQERAQMQRSRLLKLSRLMDSGVVAQAGYEALMGGRPVVIPGLINRIQAWSPRLLPRRIVPGVVRRAQQAH